MQGEDLGEVHSDRALVSNADAGLSTEPDLVFASWATLEAGGLRLLARATRADEYIELEGTPDTVVEIVSDSSERKDLVRLVRAFARAGVPEYWIVDAREAGLRFEILTLAAGVYSPSVRDGVPSSHVLRRTFALERSRNRVGRFRYLLVASPA